jgi:1,4-dihydroxy-2-naphthoyl-CoA hydrolase
MTGMDVGFAKLMGLRLGKFTADGGSAELTVRPELWQPWGILHGGVYRAIVETVASISAYEWLTAHGGGNCVGVANNTDFLHSVSSGTLRATSSPIHRGRRQQLWMVNIVDDTKRCVAQGNVRLQNLPTESSVLSAGASAVTERTQLDEGEPSLRHFVN